MKAEEIRRMTSESLANCQKMTQSNSGIFRSGDELAQVSQAASLVTTVALLGEIAAQLAELNATLNSLTTSPADGITNQLAVWVEGGVRA